MRGHLGAPPHPMQQRPHPGQAVVDPKQLGDHYSNPRQRPALILHPAGDRWPRLKLGVQPLDLPRGQPGRPSLRYRRDQRRLSTSPPPLIPVIGRLPRHPQRFGHFRRGSSLFEHLRGGHAHLLPLHPGRRPQTAAIGIPHTSGIPPAKTPVTPPLKDQYPLPSVLFAGSAGSG